MRSQDFEVYRVLLYKESGLVVTPEKAYLLESRLMPVAKKHMLASLDDLTDRLRSAPPANLLKDVVDAMTTNETMFFRDQRPFDRFRDLIMPHYQATQPGKKLKVWCAACSSGQEPYSLGMTFKENQHKFPGMSLEIYATDLSHDILEQAKRANYSQFEVQRGMPTMMLLKYFTQEGDRWILKDDIKNMVRFGEFNLLNSMATLGSFDIVFCRNVLIYFDRDTKADILGRIKKVLNPNGFLFLGGTETVLGVTDEFKALKGERGIYLPSESTLEFPT